MLARTTVGKNKTKQNKTKTKENKTNKTKEKTKQNKTQEKKQTNKTKQTNKKPFLLFFFYEHHYPPFNTRASQADFNNFATGLKILIPSDMRHQFWRECQISSLLHV